MTAYYNELDPFCVEWLKNLEREGHIAKGRIDGRDLRGVSADELTYAQCHFFAGLGGWSAALRVAGWPDELPVWTGSCPCQPFSGAGKRGGFSDERHLWPDWFSRIRVQRPAVIFGEQVAGADGLGWWDLVYDDLRGAGYAAGATDLCAAGVGAPHLRQRLYFVAVAYDHRDRRGVLRQIGLHHQRASGHHAARRRAYGGLADADLAAAVDGGDAGVLAGALGAPSGLALGGGGEAGGGGGRGGGGLADPDGVLGRQGSALARGGDSGGDALQGSRLGGGGVSERMAHAAGPGWGARGRAGEESGGGGQARLEPGRRGDAGGADARALDDADGLGRSQLLGVAGPGEESDSAHPGRRSGAGHLVADADGGRWQPGPGPDAAQGRGGRGAIIPGGDGATGGQGLEERSVAEDGRGDLREQWLAAAEAGLEGAGARAVGHPGGDRALQHARVLSGHEGQHGLWTPRRHYPPVLAGATRGFWGNCDWIPCSDGKVRPVEPGTFPLATGVPGRVGRLRAYGNAINLYVAALFIEEAWGAIADLVADWD